MTKKDAYPEKGEFILATAKEVFRQGVFVTLDEYGDKKGMLHISEISLKWVRNIRDYVKEGQKVVLKVLNVNPERGHIDLSLRRVNDAQRKEKLYEVKQKQRTKRIMELLTKELKLSKKDMEVEILSKLTDYASPYDGFEAISGENELIEKLGFKKELRAKLLDIIIKNVKTPFVVVTGFVELKSHAPDGVDVIRESLTKIQKSGSKEEIDVSYVSPPIYRVKVTAEDYKSAEKLLHKSTDKGIEHIEKNQGKGEFHKEMPEKQK